MDTNLTISIIAAVSDNGVIGKDNDIPWNLPDDLRYFNKLTNGHKIIVGRKTHQTIIKRLGHPLDNRQTIIITQQQNFPVLDNCKTVASWEGALKSVSDEKEIFVIGGTEIYQLAMPHAKRMYLTKVHTQCAGDTFFPTYDTAEWQEISSESHTRNEEDEYDYTFLVLERKQNPKSFVNLKNARVEEQYRVMETIQKGQFCPFCSENLSKSLLEPVVKRGEYWHIRKNRWPYKNTRVHLLIIHNTHTEKLSEITPEAAKELFELAQWVEEEYKISGGGLCLRFGDISVNGGTVLHLHFHLITAEITEKEDPKYQKVRFKVG